MTIAQADPATVAAARAFIRGRRRRRWFDWYAIAFAVVLVAILLSNVLAAPFSRLLGSGGSVPAQAAAGVALVAGAAAGLLMLAQAFGPLALSPADTSWLLLSPLDRRGVLRRPAAAMAVLSALAGSLLGVLALAMAGPFLPPGVHRMLWARLVLAAISGAGLFLAVVLTAVLAQPRPRQRGRLRSVAAVVFTAAALGAVASERRTAVSRAVTAEFARASAGLLSLLAAVSAAAGCAAAMLVWRMLPRFPAAVIRSEAARAGTTRMAAAFLNLPLLTWIAEDSHWRGRLLTSRRWPRPYPVAALSPAAVLAWADWRRLGRRPALLAALAVSTLAPALAGAAVTGHARSLATAGALLAGAIAAGTQGTAATRRDTNDPTLRRLLGADSGVALAARAVLPALLSAAWLILAFTLLVLAGVLPGWLWPLLGPAAGPGAAAAAVRMARTGAIDPAEQGPDTPLGPMPSWLVSRAFSVLLGIAGCYPALTAVLAGRLHGSALAAQVIVSSAVLGGYLLLTARRN